MLGGCCIGSLLGPPVLLVELSIGVGWCEENGVGWCEDYGVGWFELGSLVCIFSIMCS